MTIICPACEEHNEDGANFCEGCGAPLNSANAPASFGAAAIGVPEECAGTQIDHDGYCLECGMKHRPVVPPVEYPVSDLLASVSDIGRKHATNQDYAMAAMASDGRVVLAVSDGVSTAQLAEDASRLAVQAALRSLVVPATLSEPRVGNAVQAAHDIVCALPFVNNTELDEPMATIVVAEAQGADLTAAWVGDSRLYVVGADSAVQLTTDDTWVTLAMAGGMSEADALASPHAHEITQCLGVRDEALTIHTLRAQVAAGSWVILCSDGFWNYCEKLETLKQLVAQASNGTALALAQHLVAYANRCGGRDNISVACYKVS